MTTFDDPALRDQSLSEADYLQLESDRAKEAASAAFDEAKNHLKRIVDPRRVTRRHPWAAVATAAVAGFTATSTVVPSKRQQALRELERLADVLKSPAEQAAAAVKPDPKKSAAPANWATLLVGELIKAIRPLLVALVSGLIASKAEQPDRTPPDDALDPSDAPDLSVVPAQPGIPSPS